MVISPTLNLFVDDSQNPDYYWLDVNIPTSHGYDIVSHDAVIEISAENKFTVNINIIPSVGGSNEIEVLLGDLDADPITKNIEVTLVDGTESANGQGVVSTEEAQQETRPIDFNDLPS